MVIQGYSPLYYSCAFFCDLKIIKMLCNHPNIEVDCRDQRNSLTVFQMALSRGNAYAVKYLTENYQNIEQAEQFSELASFSLEKNHLLSLKFLIHFFKKKYNNSKSFNDLIAHFREFLCNLPQYDQRYSTEFDQIIDEIRKE